VFVIADELQLRQAVYNGNTELGQFCCHRFIFVLSIINIWQIFFAKKGCQGFFVRRELVYAYSLLFKEATMGSLREMIQIVVSSDIILNSSSYQSKDIQQ